MPAPPHQGADKGLGIAVKPLPAGQGFTRFGMGHRPRRRPDHVEHDEFPPVIRLQKGAHHLRVIAGGDQLWRILVKKGIDFGLAQGFAKAIVKPDKQAIKNEGCTPDHHGCRHIPSPRPWIGLL